MVLGGEKYRAVVGDNMVTIVPMPSPASSTTFGSKNNDNSKEATRKANETLWQEFSGYNKP